MIPTETRVCLFPTLLQYRGVDWEDVVFLSWCLRGQIPIAVEVGDWVTALKMMAAFDKVSGIGDPDRLPVVELRPFMTQEWRPCKSLPEFYDRGAGTLSSLSAASSSKRSLYSGGTTYTDPEKIALTARSDDYCRSERSSTSQRAPKVKDSFVDGSLKDAFVTKTSRERSTTDDIKSGDSANMQFSCFRRALSDIDMMRQQDLQVTGRRMDQTVPRASSMMYANHWEYYKMSKSAPTHASSQALDNLCVRINALQNAYIDSGIYDAFDRSSTLPSITVRNAPMRWKKTREEKLTRQASAKVAPPPGYRLGVANSLDVLSHYGQPVRVERQLTMQLKNTINQLRRTKDVASAIGVSAKVLGRQEFVSGDENLVRGSLDVVSVGKQEKGDGLGETASRATPNAAKSDIYMYDSGVESSRSLGGRHSHKRSRSGHDAPSPALPRTSALPLIGLPTSPQPRSLQTQERPSTSDSGVATDGPMTQLEKMPQIAESDSQRSPGKPGSVEAADHLDITNRKGEMPMSPDTADADSVDDDVIKQVNSGSEEYTSADPAAKEAAEASQKESAGDNMNKTSVHMPSTNGEEGAEPQDEEKPSGWSCDF